MYPTETESSSFPYDLEQRRIWFTVLKTITIYGLEKDREERIQKRSSEWENSKHCITFSPLLHTFSTSLEFSATILLQVLDLLAIAAGNNFSALLYAQAITVYKIKEQGFWQADTAAVLLLAWGQDSVSPRTIPSCWKSVFQTPDKDEHHGQGLAQTAGEVPGWNHRQGTKEETLNNALIKHEKCSHKTHYFANRHWCLELSR